MGTYFTADGTWGSTEGLLVADTDNWTEAEFERIDECADSERTLVVRNILGLRQHSKSAIPTNDPCYACVFEVGEYGSTVWITCDECDWGNV